MLKKELLIASAINKSPDILILDEPFEGLDPKSIETLEAVLKRHLPNSLIIVVDNRAHDNDYNFYDEVLGFSDKTIVTRNRGLKYFKKLFA